MKAKEDFQQTDQYIEYLQTYYLGCAIGAGKTPIEAFVYVESLMSQLIDRQEYNIFIPTPKINQ